MAMGNGKRLTRSETDRMLGGVCGGLGAYFGVDPTLVRIGFVVVSLFAGGGILVYLALWVIVPTESSVGASPRENAGGAVGEMRDELQRGADEVRNAYRRSRDDQDGDSGGTGPDAGR
jgi:phage shock protein C